MSTELKWIIQYKPYRTMSVDIQPTFSRKNKSRITRVYTVTSVDIQPSIDLFFGGIDRFIFQFIFKKINRSK